MKAYAAKGVRVERSTHQNNMLEKENRSLLLHRSRTPADWEGSGLIHRIVILILLAIHANVCVCCLRLVILCFLLALGALFPFGVLPRFSITAAARSRA
jgi:hypothetical protein